MATLEEQVGSLHGELREVLRSISHEAGLAALYESKPYLAIIELGLPAVPLLMEKIKAGEHELNEAVCRILMIDRGKLTKYAYPTERELSAALLETESSSLAGTRRRPHCRL